MTKEGDDHSLFSEFAPTSFEAWLDKAKASLKGASYEKAVVTKTDEGFDLQPIYWRKDIEERGHHTTLPGFPPYLRGTAPEGYTETPWHICQELAASTPGSFQAVANADLSRGQTALGVVLDEPTLSGLDVDQAEPTEVGRAGLSLSNLEDFRVAFAALDVKNIPIHVCTGAVALPFLSHIATLHDASQLRGCIGADPLGELARTGELSMTIEKAYDCMSASAAWARDRAPLLRTVLVRGCPYHEGGASATEELATSIATATAYLRAMIERGLDPSDAAKQIRFVFSLGTRFFMEIGKLRAARLLWSQVVEAFGGDSEAQRMEIHARTSAWAMTAFDPYVNMLRNTTEAFSGALGGVNSLHVRPFDEPVRGSAGNEFARRVSRNVQLLLIQESHATHPIDPAGGAWFIESLVDTLARAAWKLFQEIEAEKGMLAALRSGFIQDRIAATAAERAANVGTRRDALIGTNKYPNLRENPLDIPDIDEHARHRARVLTHHRFRSETTSIDDRARALDAIVDCQTLAESTTVDLGIKAIETGATLGDLFQALFGIGKPESEVKAIRASRSAEAFELLRRNTEAYEAETGQSLQVFLANVGPISQHKARADFVTEFFEIGGFQVLRNNGFPDAESAARAALDSNAPIVVICSTDAVYPDVVPALIRTIKAEKPDVVVVLAGRPAQEHKDSYFKEGLDHAIFIGSDCYGLLHSLQTKMGVANDNA